MMETSILNQLPFDPGFLILGLIGLVLILLILLISTMMQVNMTILCGEKMQRHWKM